MEITAPELWIQVLEAARPGLPEQSFRTWLAGTRAVGLSIDLSEGLRNVKLPNLPQYADVKNVAGYLVEVMSGMPLDEFLEKRIFSPLKMVDTGF